MRFPTDSLSSPLRGEELFTRERMSERRGRDDDVLDPCSSTRIFVIFFLLLLFNYASQFRFLNYFNILNSLETNLYVDVIFDLTNLSGKQGIFDV